MITKPCKMIEKKPNWLCDRGESDFSQIKKIHPEF